MLREVAQRGTSIQQEQATRALQITALLRDERMAVAETGGRPAAAHTAATQGKNRQVYTADQGSTLPGRLVRREGEPAVGDAATDEAYTGAGDTYDLYLNAYSRHSIDDHDMQLNSTVHYQKGYDNAFWNGSQMVYGDGDEDLPPDQQLFNRFTIALDVIGHELTHGVTQFTANLNYFNQSGALNESISDVFGSLVKQNKLNQAAAQADWIIGEGLFTSNVHGQGIRSMKAPGTAYDDPVLGKDPQPAHMKDYNNTLEDNGGVHINSGIPNHAFYVTAVEIGGNAWDKAGRIWYATLKDKLQPGSDFQSAALLTYQAAGELFGEGSLEQKAVRTGWAEVGISVEASPNPNPGCLPSLAKLIM
ncbi:MAG TPA: M4 family metallopeptidase, partial [Anaerolineales bacterium]